MDNELRSGKDKKSDDMLEQTLDKALMLFRYISVRLIHLWNNESPATPTTDRRTYWVHTAAMTNPARPG